MMISDESQLEYSPGTVLTIDEAAQRIGINEDEMEDLVRNGLLNTRMFDGEPCIHIAVLDHYVASLTGVADALSSNRELDDVPR